MAESLRPCPFCGGEAAYEEIEDRASTDPEAIRFSVGCGNEDCVGYQSMASFPRRIDAIAAWNRRAGVETFELRTVPTAWVRGVKDADTANGPGEWNADFVYGDDRPDGDGWIPLYSKPPHIRPAEETTPSPFCAICDHSEEMHRLMGAPHEFTAKQVKATGEQT